MTIQSLKQIRSEGSDYVSRHTEDIRKQRAKRLKAGETFQKIDKSIQDEAFNALIEDYLNEHNHKASAISSELSKVSVSLDELTTQSRKEIESKFNSDSTGMAVNQLQSAVTEERTKLDELKKLTSAISKELSSAKEKIQNQLQWQDPRKAFESIEAKIAAYEVELLKIGEGKKAKLGEDMNKYLAALRSSLESVMKNIENDLNAFRETRKTEMGKLYDLEAIDAAGKSPWTRKLVNKFNEAMENLKMGVDPVDLLAFFKSSAVLLILVALASYDYIFLYQIFSDVLTSGSADDALIQPLFFNISKLSALSFAALFALIVMYALGGKMLDHDRLKFKVYGFIVEAFVILILIFLIWLSLFTFENNGLQFLPESWITEFGLRLAMIPILLVWDFLLVGWFIHWDKLLSVIGQFAKILVAPVWGIYQAFWLVVSLFRQLGTLIIVETRRKKLVKMIEENEETISRILQPDISFDPNLTRVTINPVRWTTDVGQIRSSGNLGQEYAEALSLIHEALSTIGRFEDKLRALDNVVIEKTNGFLEAGKIVDTNSERSISWIRAEYENRIKMKSEERNQLIGNLKIEENNIKTIKYEMKEGILEGYRKMLDAHA